jgi:ribosomal protein RSM22 (predicted rRNA methylase)
MLLCIKESICESASQVQEGKQHLADAHAARTEAAVTAAQLSSATDRLAALEGDVERAIADIVLERSRAVDATKLLFDAHKRLAAESDKLQAAEARAERLAGEMQALNAHIAATTEGRKEAEVKASDALREKHLADADLHAAREQRRLMEER